MGGGGCLIPWLGEGSSSSPLLFPPLPCPALPSSVLSPLKTLQLKKASKFGKSGFRALQNVRARSLELVLQRDRGGGGGGGALLLCQKDGARLHGVLEKEGLKSGCWSHLKASRCLQSRASGLLPISHLPCSSLVVSCPAHRVTSSLGSLLPARGPLPVFHTWPEELWEPSQTMPPYSEALQSPKGPA